MVNPFSKYRLGERDTQGCRLEDADRGLLQYIVCCQMAEDAHYMGTPISFYIPILLGSAVPYWSLEADVVKMLLTQEDGIARW